MAGNTIELVQLFEDGSCNLCGYYAKGHVDPQAFAAEVDWEYEREIEIPAKAVHQGYMRLVPCGEDGALLAYMPVPPGRGAFAATWWVA
jgi:hypothetical protein